MRVFAIDTRHGPRIEYDASRNKFVEITEQPFILIADTQDENREIIDFIKKHVRKDDDELLDRMFDVDRQKRDMDRVVE